MSSMLTPINGQTDISGNTSHDDELQRLRRVIREGYAACVRRSWALSQPTRDLRDVLTDRFAPAEFVDDVRAILSLREEAEKLE